MEIDEDETGVISLRVMATLMAMISAKENGLGHDWALTNYRMHLEAAKTGMDNSKEFDADIQSFNKEREL